MTEQEKYFARFYSRGQVVVFSRDNVGLGIARDAEYKVIGVGRDARGRQTVNLVDEHGRTIQRDPRLGRAAQINVFTDEQRDLAAGDRVQTGSASCRDRGGQCVCVAVVAAEIKKKNT